MEPSFAKQMGLGILAWTVYFLAVFLICNWIYSRLSGKPPGNPNASVLKDGKTAQTVQVWEARDRRLRRVFIGIGVALIFLPLLLPFLLRWMFS